MNNRINRLRDIEVSLRFFQLILTNDLICKRVSRYIIVDEFMKYLIKEVYNVSFVESNFLDQLDEPFELYSKEENILLQIRLCSNEEKIIETIHQFEDIKSNNREIDDLRLIIIPVGLERISKRYFFKENFNSFSFRKDIVTVDKLLNKIRRLKDPKVIKNLQTTIHSKAGVFDKLLKKPTPLSLKIIEYISFQNQSIGKCVSVMIPKNIDMLDKSLIIRDVNKIDNSIILNIMDVFSAYSVLSSSSFRVIDRVYASIRRVWVEYYNECSIDTLKLRECYVDVLSKELLENGCISANELDCSRDLLSAIVLESLIRSRITINTYNTKSYSSDFDIS